MIFDTKFNATTRLEKKINNFDYTTTTNSRKKIDNRKKNKKKKREELPDRK